MKVGENMQLITEDQALEAIKNGEFDNEIIRSSAKVAVILTQSWCPQWQAMRQFVTDFTGADIYSLEYDRTDYFDEFRRFKEQTFGNDQIPYVRYYANGVLVAESNAVSQQLFQLNLEK